ncbi:hypothetical protein PAT3040_01669 [Paenibacillus agaridevorans]|uniref:FIMAH domain-containing protein n=2 Tax=Paenibacillus agaridevorans TaxID=171404 RepID=A0A2R5EUQ8_9BACL|nr:hypothetical protein PAT3040_01669 [Paenibacillus agaridevorans]
MLHGAQVLKAEGLAIVDESEDFSKVFMKTANIQVSTSSPERYNGDTSRFYKTSEAEAYVIYEVPHTAAHAWTGFHVETWYNKGVGGQLPGDMSFEVSNDNITYTAVGDYSKIVSSLPQVGGWSEVSWAASSLPAGTKYIKLIFGNTTNHPSTWAIQIGKVMLYAEDNSLQALHDEIASAQVELDHASAGTNPGEYPVSAVQAFMDAISAAQVIADNSTSSTAQLQAAYADLVQARALFKDTFILALNWPASASITAAAAGPDKMTIAWPSIMEADSHSAIIYHVYKNDSEVAAVAGTTYTFTGLRPQMDYEFHIVASSEGDQSKVLGPAVLTTATIGPVPAPDFSLLDVDDFADEDFISPRVWNKDRRGIPYYYYHFSTVVNAVRLEKPNRGFIDIVVHRGTANNFPYNARVQENHLWFTYFYTNPASWNMYYGMPEVKVRLEEVLEHLLTLQSPEGAFSEYGWQSYNLAGTTFAVQFLGQTVRLLNEAKAKDVEFTSINEDLYNRVVEAYRKALVHVLNDNELWTYGRSYTNQFTLIWSAAAAYLEYFPDPAIEQQMRVRFAQSASELISPAGFYYEADGFDMGYNLGVHLQNDLIGYHYFKDTDLEQPFLEKERAFFDWLSYNLVLEPDGSFFTPNAAPSRRTTASSIERKDIPLAEKLPIARAFVRTQEEIAAEIAQAKADIIKDNWPNVDALKLGGDNSFNPYGLYNRLFNRYYPTENERSVAIQTLPYLASDRFNHQRVDDRSGLQFTYLRRPDYYATFNAGLQRGNLQVFGLGLIWHPEGGIMMSSQTEASSLATSRNLSWGTRSMTGSRVYENGTVTPVYSIDGVALQPEIGHGDVAQGDVEMKYSLGTAGNKTISFAENSISVTVQHQEAFEERIPLMIGPDDHILEGAGSVKLIRGNVVLEITFDEAAETQLEQTDFNIFQYRMQVLTLKTSSGNLSYTLSMSTVKPAFNIPLLREKLDFYKNSGALQTPLYQQLSKRLDQAEHHLDKGQIKQMIKKLRDFQKQLNNPGLQASISEDARVLLFSEAQALIDQYSE